MDIQDVPKSRTEAKANGNKYYFTGIPCKYGHIALRKIKGQCIECKKIENEEARSKRASYYQQYNQSEKGKEAKRRYYERNREAVIARAAARPAKEKFKYHKAWRSRNTLLVNADNKNRRRKHRQASPPWLTRKQRFEMRELYKIATTMVQTTGVKYVVDHIVPLRSEFVCGLHVPWNLRVITQEENLKKSNKLVDTLFMPVYTGTSGKIRLPDSPD